MPPVRKTTSASPLRLARSGAGAARLPNWISPDIKPRTTPLAPPITGGRSISRPCLRNNPAFQVTIIGPAPWPMVAKPALILISSAMSHFLFCRSCLIPITTVPRSVKRRRIDSFARLNFFVSVRLIARFALTAFTCQRIIEFRNALSGKAIAVFCFWRRHASINHSIDCHCIREFVSP